jgi:pyruvate dehydrogenase E2 component (dihydrolipoamide acetyltransferase)
MAQEIVIPRLGWSMEEGIFVGWLKADGDTVRAGEPIFELEGEKGVQEIEAVDEGVLRIPTQSPAPGTTVKVGTVIGFVAAPDEAVPALGNGEASAKPAAKPAATAPAVAPAAGPAARRMARQLNVPIAKVRGSGPSGRVSLADVQRAGESKAPIAATRGTDRGARIVASPRAKRVAKELGIDWTTLVGSGSGGRIRERDVRAAAETNGDAVNGQTAGRRVPISHRRRVIAQRMSASSQQTAPVTLTTRANAANLVNLREQFKALGDSAVTPSYQDVIVKLVAGALVRHPLLAGRWDDDAIVLPAADAIHIRIAVDTESGLLAPVIRNANALSIGEIAAASRQLIERSQSGRITAAEFEGGVFTISNLGAFGVDAFTPIINLPEVAILGLGAIRREAIVADDGQTVAGLQMTLSLTFDHRVVDGAPAARFLQDVATAIANPSACLLNAP